ncbi:MAG: hypothetical protein IKC58_01485 [Clostridia bacterium]|nr:hypothetical protein [Clostridia bacterium]
MNTVDENNCNVQSTKELISDMYKNVTMAQGTIKTLTKYVKQKDVKERLHKQIEQYDHYIEQIGTVGANLGFDPTPAPKFALAMANMGIKTKMLANQKQTHVAKIMMQGTLNGIIDLYRLDKKYQDAHPQTASLLKEILHYEESCLEACKNML